MILESWDITNENVSFGVHLKDVAEGSLFKMKKTSLRKGWLPGIARH